MKTLSVTKTGDKLTIVLNGVMYTKEGEDSKELVPLIKEYYKLKNQDEKDVIFDKILVLIDNIKRLEINGILEQDSKTEKYYLKGFDKYPIPEFLCKTMLDYIDNDFPIDAIVNFWKLLMTNPDQRVVESLFKHLSQSNYAITNHGYGVGYKKVILKSQITSNLYENFINDSFEKIKKQKKSPKKFYVVTYDGVNEYSLLAEDKKPDKKTISCVNLFDEYTRINQNIRYSTDEIYTDIHSKTFSIKIGEPVREKRENCDSDPNAGCSNGLHIGTDKYVRNFGGVGEDTVVLACLFNPAHVVSVPNEDNSTKMRVCEYFPYAKLRYNKKDNKFTTIEQKYFESDYLNYEKADIEETLSQEKLEQDVITLLKDRLVYIHE